MSRRLEGEILTSNIMDYILTLLVPIALVFCVLWGNKRVKNQDAFMNKDFTKVLKGACSIIVILVHIPLAYQNKVQNGIGSFAYVCVTLFFLMSAYGMNFSSKKNPNYIKHFWRNRLSALLIPQFVLNVFIFSVSCLTSAERVNNPAHLISINSYVLVLLQYCFWFYILSLGKRFYGEKTFYLLLILGVAVSSLVAYFCFDADGWCYERWGLVWGVFLSLFLPQVRQFVRAKTNKILLWGMLSLVFGIAYLSFKPVFFYGEYLLKIVLGLIIIIFLFTLSSQRKFGNMTINFLGEISYEVYLSHGFIMLLLKTFIPQLSSGLFVLMTVILTIGFSTIVHYIDKPIVKFCRKK